MPLYKGKPLKQQTYKRLPDDQEVFFCELTNEIFERYEEYCERVISCSCCIWSCAITGKSGLTYQEALDSEEKALQNIKDFAPELRTPVLYLASLTAATHFSEMADIVYHFVKNRYFVGESVQACFDGDDWSYAQVVNVLLPTAEEVMAYCERTKAKHPIQHRPYYAELYKYKVEEIIDDESDDDSDDEPQHIRHGILTNDKVKRVKSLYTKDKNRAFLKQFCEQKKNGLWGVKSAIMDKYGISTVDFCDIFVGEPPVLKKLSLPGTPATKNGPLKQESMKKFLVNGLSPNKNELNKSKSKGAKKLIKETPDKTALKGSVSHQVAKKIQKKYSATIEKVISAASKEEERENKLKLLREKKEAKRQEKEKLDLFTKEWQKKREDLECEDLKDLPVPCPVECRLPNSLFGEFVMILEFLASFKEVLRVKDYFPYGLSFDLLERALLDNEIAGPFNDILQLFLSAIFVFQEDEDDEVSKGAVYGVSLDEAVELTGREAIKAATQAAQWSRTFHNVPLSKLHMDAITVTDILRLHLLAAGRRVGDLSTKWRLQERGGYVGDDDPGLEFRQKEPQILKFLATNSVAALKVDEKLKVLHCLMNQILTYASVRDVMDERYEKVFTGRKDIKIEQVLEGKKDRERLKKAREAKEQGNKQISIDEKERIAVDIARRENEYQRRLMEMRELALGYQVLPLGQDRAYRRYYVFTGIPGLFVEDDEQWPGACLPNPTKVNPSPADDDDTMNYIRRLFEASGTGTGSDKENEGDGSLIALTPKKKHLGEVNGVCELSPTTSEHKSSVKLDENRPLICTSNAETCSIHNRRLERTKWMFFYKEEEIDELIKNLNKRGYREGALRELLVSDKERIINHMVKCPVQKLNRFAPVTLNVSANKVVSTRSVKGYEDANLKYPPDTPIDIILELYLRDVILDTEEKIFMGALGCIKVPDRKAWREAIEARGYESQDENLCWPTKLYQNNKKIDDDPNSRAASPFSETSDASDEPNRIEQSSSVRDLAMAVLQLERGIEPKFLQKPLQYEEKKSAKLTGLERWELSLMLSSSFSQVYLHHASLDNSIQWNKSVLNAKCKVCRRGKDDINMLLCDGCDRGFHLYCLKPKLSSIPRGDWFCPDCRPKEKAPRQRSSRRRLLEEEEVEESDDEPLTRSRRVKRRRETDDSCSWEEPQAKRSR